ncbi:hypothetical protein GCM10007063_34710 [Lentibacillus kapialis]|uniref:Uncharacterized protein n=1 Tax=Lentibacillus kapialis TaxID=340214 RepID=A0A917Q3C2_9BACI|nr:hypothetical protein GCM10007063_34710 [Lentibacillus kapialis]
MDIVVSYLGITITLYLSFQVKTILKVKENAGKISSLATFLFHIWYLQYG